MQERNQHNPNVSTVRQYRAQIFDPNGTVTITSTSLQDCQKKVRQLVGTNVRFDPTNDTVQAIYSDSHLKGTQPLGWIAEMEIPELLSVKNVTEHRLAVQRAA